MPQHPAAAAKPAPSAVPHSPFPVVVGVVVTDPQHRFVAGLEKDNFRVFEDGVEQEISRFSSDAVPVSVGLVLDTSGSMRTKFQGVEQAVLQFLRTANPEDEFFVVQFNQVTQLASGFTRNREEIQSRLDQIHPEGGTALWDAIYLAVQQLEARHNPQQAILVITDTGVDNSSSHPYSELVTLQRWANVPDYTINTAAPAAAPPLADLSEQTGGRDYVVETPEMLPDAMARIGVEMRNQYRIEYTPTNARHIGTYHRLGIELSPPPGLPPLTVRTRAGHYARRQ